MKSVTEVIDDLQARMIAYEVLFQSIFYSLPDEVKASAIATVEENFKAFDSGSKSESTAAKLAAAKVIAARVSGAKL